jgi:hypothetical protein
MRGTEFEELKSQISTLSDLMTVQAKELSHINNEMGHINNELSEIKIDLSSCNKRLSMVEITVNGMDKKLFVFYNFF